MTPTRLLVVSPHLIHPDRNGNQWHDIALLVAIIAWRSQ